MSLNLRTSRGKQRDRATRLLGAAAVPAAAVLLVDLPRVFVELPDVPQGVSRVRLGLAVLVWSLFWGAGLYAQTYRYRHVSGPLQRQQTKWVALTLGLIFLVLLLGFVIPSLVVDTANAWFAWALLATAPYSCCSRPQSPSRSCATACTTSTGSLPGP